jgi:hypothetical protein
MSDRAPNELLALDLQTLAADWDRRYREWRKQQGKPSMSPSYRTPWALEMMQVLKRHGLELHK